MTTTDELRDRFAAAEVAVLGTKGRERPHLVPVVFAMTDADVVVTAIDQKPKTTRALRRLENIERSPAVTLLVDHYSDDWTHLWWVRADGVAVIHSDATAMAAAQTALSTKYPVYRLQPPIGPVIEIAVSRWVGWSAR